MHKSDPISLGKKIFDDRTSALILQPDETLQAAEVGLARAQAMQNATEIFDPANNFVDRESARRLSEMNIQFAQRLYASQIGTVNVENRERERSELGDEPVKPHFPGWLFLSAVLVLALTITPTLATFVISLDDIALSWVLSLLFSLAMGYFVTSLIVYGRSVSMNRMGVVAGIVLAGGLGVLRLSRFETFGDVAFALALTTLEIACVLGLESVARTVAAREHEMNAKIGEIRQAENAIETAKIERDRRREELADTQKEIERLLEEIKDRDRRSDKELAAAEATAEVSYQGQQAVAHNQAKLAGVWVRENRK
jgi:hypothetical protein